MIDFSCCEVQKAIKGLFADNEVLSITPIVKAYGQPFEDDRVYYGAFANPQGQTVKYRGHEIDDSNIDILFNVVENPAYDTFTGYEVRLKNQLTELYTPSMLTINVVIDSSADPWGPDLKLDGVSIVDGHQIPYSVAEAGFTLSDAAAEIGIRINGGMPSNPKAVTSADFVSVEDNYEINVQLIGVA